MTRLTVSVVVVTYERPAYVRRCLTHLLAQTVVPDEIIVVDSSLSGETAEVVTGEFPSVVYAEGPRGLGATSVARNTGYHLAVGDVLAFVDDDAFAAPDWLEHLLAHYGDPTVGGVGGRQIRGVPGELEAGADDIGRFLPDGTMTDHFAADPGRPVEVDHLLGANMSFRRSVIDEVGGIRAGYAGTCLREETDISLRVTHAGYRLIYAPDAVVEHVAGPYAKGQRFDLRYAYWAQKNHLILLIRNFGPRSAVTRSYLAASIRQAGQDASTRTVRAWSRARGSDPTGALRALGAMVLRSVVVGAATVTGAVAGCVLAARESGR